MTTTTTNVCYSSTKKTMKESAVLSIEVRNVMKYKNHSTKLCVFFSRLRFAAVLECITISLSSLV